MRTVRSDSNASRASLPGGVGAPLIWPIWERAAGQAMVYGRSAHNRVYNFKRVCPKQGEVAQLSSLNMGCPKQGPRIESDVPLRVGILGLFLS